MQIHRCMPRPNNWTPASKYFKMPFCLLLIVFRPQCEETRQEHVGVAWRAAEPAYPQSSSKAIKKGFLLVESIIRHCMTQAANIQSCNGPVFLSHLVLIWLSVMPPSPHGERKGSPCFPVWYYHIPYTAELSKD